MNTPHDTSRAGRAKEMSGPISRRLFLLGAGALALAPGVLLTAPPAGAVQVSGKRWGLLVDTRLCDAHCTACIDACGKEHGLQGVTDGAAGADSQWIRKVQISDKGTGQVSHMPIMCQHCGQAPCVEVCPTGASMRRADGLVLVDRHVCIGCRYCLLACPFKARRFVDGDVPTPLPHSPRGKGTAEGCTLCAHRIDQGRLPACVEACAQKGHKAMLFGDLNDPTSAIAKRVVAYGAAALRPDLRTDPGVRYEGVSL